MAPLLPITIALITGILLKVSGISALFMILPAVFTIFLILRHHHNAAVIISAGMAGYLIAFVHTPIPLDSDIKESTHTFSGIIKETNEYESSRMIIVEIDSCEHLATRPFLAKLFIPSSLPVFDIADRIGFSSTLDDLKSEAYLPDEIDYNLPLIRQGVIADGIVDPKNIYYSYPESGFLNSIFRFRIELTRIIALTPLSTDTKDFLITALAGDRSFLLPDTRDLFSHTGLAHILALSGLHVGILTWVITIMLLPLTISGLRNGRIITTIVLLWIFAIMTGLTPSVVRAVIMSTLYLIATIFERKHASFNSLCFAAIVILLFTPFSLFTIGFQLSFLAVAAILLLSTKINPVSPKRRIPHIAVSYLTVTLSAMLGTGIVSAYYFGIFPVYFLVTNIITSLLLPFLLGGGIIIVIGQIMGYGLVWISVIVDLFYHTIIKIATLMESLPGAYIDNLNIPTLTIPLYFLALTFIVLYLYRRKRIWVFSSALTGVFLLIISIIDRPIYGDNALYIPPSHSGTIILVKEYQKLWLISNLQGVEQQELKHKLERHYHKYLAKRGIDTISILPTVYRTRLLTRKESIVRTMGKTIAIINSPEHVLNYNIPIDYALVTKGFREDVTSISDKVKADTIVLSGDINLRRHNRYAGELKDAGIPCIRLRYEPIILE